MRVTTQCNKLGSIAILPSILLVINRHYFSGKVRDWSVHFHFIKFHAWISFDL